MTVPSERNDPAVPSLSQRVISPFSREPIRDDWCNVEQRTIRAQAVASHHHQVHFERSAKLLKRVRDNAVHLNFAYRQMKREWAKHPQPGGIVEWVLDNYHIIDENVREVKTDLPSGYLRELPRTSEAPFDGLPRIYPLALDLIACTDSILDQETIKQYVNDFQRISPLSVGEIWAVPIMLRIGLLENLRRLTDRHYQSIEERRHAAQLVHKHLRTQSSVDLFLDEIGRVLESDDHFVSAFLAGIVDAAYLGEDETTRDADVVTQALARHNLRATDVLRQAQAAVAADRISTGNCITSLRMLDVIEWKEFFEETSLLEATLRLDPAGVYSKQDAQSRDRCRHAVEDLARGSNHSELEVGTYALELAQSSEGVQRHIGYYLLGQGRREVEIALHYRGPIATKFNRWARARRVPIYLGSIAGITLLFTAVLFYLSGAAHVFSGAVLSLAVILTVVAVSELGVSIVNYLALLLVPPRLVPKLDTKDGIPEDCPTFVVIPTMLTSSDSPRELTERLERHYLSNSDPQLWFALLTDFPDDKIVERDTDEPLVRETLALIDRLNEKYASTETPRFFLLHRKRTWNAKQNRWMGWERKRGKLLEFSRLLRGEADTTFITISDGFHQLPRMKFILTLDTDTQLPHEAARRLVGAAAHPLNEPVVSADGSHVESGYTFYQPRVDLSLTAARKSNFTMIYGRSAGIDPYSVAASDVYQDVFNEGSFIGKGLFHVDAADRVLDQAFPENLILSHDLIEGNLTRCTLVSDVQFMDEFPSQVSTFLRREHRWIRGDWQIFSYLLPRMPLGKPNPQTLIKRWKIADNLRRSLVPPAITLLFLVGWLLPFSTAVIWTALTSLILFFPLIVGLIDQLRALIRGTITRLAWRTLPYSLGATGLQCIVETVFLLERARLSLDAVARTLSRLFVTRRNLLEWETAAAVERKHRTSFWGQVQTFSFSSIAASFIALTLSFVNPESLLPATPILLSWFIAPIAAYFLGLPYQRKKRPLSRFERQDLRSWGRKTWAFFETFVNEASHHLPPDNFQEIPEPKIAQRTSPTNIGLYLLSNLAANDLGYIGLVEMIERLDQTMNTLDRLKRWNGHLINWYDTHTLDTLHPEYVSTVDSGNLYASLIALKHGIDEKLLHPINYRSMRAGLRDAYRIAREEFDHSLKHTHPSVAALLEKIAQHFKRLEQIIDEKPVNSIDFLDWVLRAKVECQMIRRLADDPSLAPVRAGTDVVCWVDWVDATNRSIASFERDIRTSSPWITLLHEVPQALTVSTHSKSTPSYLDCWRELREKLIAPLCWHEFRKAKHSWQECLENLKHHLPKSKIDEATAAWIDQLETALSNGPLDELWERVLSIRKRVDQLANEMNFRVLYNEERQLFAIGFNVTTGQLDRAHYDLLASEAALTSFLMVARGDAPQRHWFHLSRPVTGSAMNPALISWGGTMFEYLMPRLLLRPPEGTLLHVSQESAVEHQIAYGQEMNVPWGISESSYAVLNAGDDYQYQAFGVPTLGLKRGSASDLVVSPYSTMLALPVMPHESVRNLHVLKAHEAEGRYGFHEAIDFSADRVTDKSVGRVVRSFMAHHQGMSLLAIVNTLFDDVMPRRLERDPIVRATELLLEERVPFDAPRQVIEHASAESPEGEKGSSDEQPMVRRLATPHTSFPRSHLLSNGEYSIFVSHSGASRSKWEDIDVTHWRADRARDNCGTFIYLRVPSTGRVWSAGYQPVRVESDSYEVTFSSDRAEIRQVDSMFETVSEILVSPTDPVEIRIVAVTNRTRDVQTVEWTSYSELVLTRHADDVAHPAFQKLFLETEYIPSGAILCRRRGRSSHDQPIWAFQSLVYEGKAVGKLEFETDRRNFVGRNRSTSNPLALDWNQHLGGSAGPVLDPIFSLRRQLKLKPNETARVVVVMGTGRSREEVLLLADRYRDIDAIDRMTEIALARGGDDRSRLRISPSQEQLFQRLSAQVIYPGALFRTDASTIDANRLRAVELGRLGISGDRPIVLAHLASEDHLPLARDLIQAHAFWRTRGLEVDLVFLDEHATGYFDEIQRQLREMIRNFFELDLLDRPGGVFVRNVAHLTPQDQILLRTAACCEFHGNRGILLEQVNLLEAQPSAYPNPIPTSKKSADRYAPSVSDTSSPLDLDDLSLRNGYGGLSADGKEYRILLAGKSVSDHLERSTPLPWSNVVANPQFGFLVTESGSSFTWAVNSQANRLTPWSNDPVSDPSGEIIYLRDEESKEVWTPTPEPIRDGGPYLISHGAGYSRFEHQRRGISSELEMSVAPEDPVKLFILRLTNNDSVHRSLTATLYVEWVLGTNRQRNAPYIVTEVDHETGTLLARNSSHPECPDRIAFIDTSMRPRSYSADRLEFIGRNGSVDHPAAMQVANLSARIGAGLDPCGALCVPIVLPPHGTEEIIFVMGQGNDRDHALRLATQYRQPPAAQATRMRSIEFWNDLLSVIEVETPVSSFDAIVNRWLLYQTVSCRFWGRSGFYQSGGAYGFRDQLQDSMALLHSLSEEARAHLLRSASRQFPEGDVQHWWHPPGGGGVRTRISDDFLWLPFVVCEYIDVTGDVRVLDESVPFIQGPLLQPGQEDDYRIPDITSETATLYDHCIRAIRNGCKFGSHGLPLMGTGDWNDGMNRVGHEGRGESVFNAWFLLANLRRFAKIAESRQDHGVVQEFDTVAQQLLPAIELNAWDGQWYLRAYFDNGMPLGSQSNNACQIDSIAQSWGVLSHEGDSIRCRQAMNSVIERLVDTKHRLIKLFDPPFRDADSSIDPGYVKGYLAGIRENGGQYTHAATWVVMAFAEMGDAERAFRLFQILNPLERVRSKSAADTYMIEPYVLAGDVYGEPPNAGRGGWSWYTGSSGWLYRVGIESIVGLRREGNKVRFQPRVPNEWNEYTVRYRFGRSLYTIQLQRAKPDEDASVRVDEAVQESGTISLIDDGAPHEVKVIWKS
jgi:cyclic beta-1,2-glucan synthetase